MCAFEVENDEGMVLGFMFLKWRNQGGGPLLKSAGKAVSLLKRMNNYHLGMRRDGIVG